ncbi:MAG: hypothetical protein AABX82_06285 [Nanoarchaeota archaeon]
MEQCKPQCAAIKMVVAGLVLIGVRMYTTWDIWLVIGAMLAIKGALLFVMPVCPCTKKK